MGYGSEVKLTFCGSTVVDWVFYPISKVYQFGIRPSNLASSSRDNGFDVDVERSWIHLLGSSGLSLGDGLLFVLVWSWTLCSYRDVVIVPRGVR